MMHRPKNLLRQPMRHCRVLWWIRLASVVTLLMTTVAVAPLCAQELPPIVDVRVEGNETIPESVILQKVQSQPDRPVSETQLREDKRSLMSTRWFFSVNERIEKTDRGDVLVFEVHERPIVQRVAFLGHDKIKEKNLAAWTGLKVGSPFDYVANREAVHRIEQEYREKGFHFAKVTLVKGGDPADREVVFRIVEGPKVRVLYRRFEGNKFWGDGDLRKNLVSKAALLGFLGGLYRPETLPQDVESLKQYYRAVGFFDVEVEATPLFSPDKARVTLEYKINEGRRYQVRQITYNGNTVVPTGQCTEGSRLNPGEFFNAHELSKDVQRIQGYYEERGHYFARVQPVPHFLEQPGIVDLVVEIDEDRPRFIREINVSYTGDYPHTKQTVILDRMQVSPGDLANTSLIRRGRSRVAGSGLFEPGVQFDVVRVEPETESFVSRSRTIRGQQPDLFDSPDGWADRLAVYALNSAKEEVTSIQTRTSNKANGFSTAEGSEVRNAGLDADFGGHSSLRPAPEPPDVPQPTTSAPDIPQHQSSTGSTDPAAPRSSMTGFRPAQATALFALPCAQFLHAASAGSGPQRDHVIRAQSYDGSFGGPQPAWTDPVLEGSPYRNQFEPIPPGWVDINVNAAEGRTGRLMFGAGVNSDAGVVGSFVWDESNFDLFRPPRTFADVIEGRAWRGGGQRFRLEAAPGDIVSRYALSWTDPYFMYTDYSLSVSGFYFNRFYPDWDEDRVGGRISVGRQLSPEWSVAGTIRLESVNLKNPNAPTPPEVLRDVGQNFLSTGRLSVTHDTRDAAIMPGEGHYLDVGYEQAFGDYTYPRVEGEGRQYFTLYNRPDGSGRQVLTLAGNIGWSGNDTPVFEQYFAGGFQSFRGYAFRGVSPRVGGVATGGTFQMLGTAEYRVPVTADDMISVVAFSDFGSVEDSATLENFRITAGVGLRVVVPAMGPVPLAFDFAFPLRSQPFDDERMFSFYVGLNR
jgi:outer membrane protein insertion porin family